MIYALQKHKDQETQQKGRDGEKPQQKHREPLCTEDQGIHV